MHCVVPSVPPVSFEAAVAAGLDAAPAAVVNVALAASLGVVFAVCAAANPCLCSCFAELKSSVAQNFTMGSEEYQEFTEYK